MMKDVDLSISKNLLTLSVILIAGIGGLALDIPYKLGYIPTDAGMMHSVIKVISIGNIAFALVLGVITYNICSAVEKRNIPDDVDNNKSIDIKDGD